MANYIVDKKERRVIKVKWIGEPQPIFEGSSVKVMRFNGEDGLQYEVWATHLQEYIKSGDNIDADVELRLYTSKDGAKTYPHLVVTQIYIEGKPVNKPQATTKRSYGRDEDRVDERTAILETGENWRTGKIKDNEPEIIVYRAWLIDKLPGKGGKHETAKVGKDKQVDNKPEEEQVPEQDSGEATDREKQIARIGELGEKLGWSAQKKIAHMKTLFQKGSINKLTKEELDTLESDLIARKDSIPFEET